MKRVTLLSRAGNLEIQFGARADLTAAIYLMWKEPERKSIEVPSYLSRIEQMLGG
jgi:hypothetical protein